MVSGTRDKSYYIPPNTKKKAVLRYKVRLPPYVTCTQCVLQWTYYTGEPDGQRMYVQSQRAHLGPVLSTNEILDRPKV